MKQPNETQTPPQSEAQKRMKVVQGASTFELIKTLKRYDAGFASAYGPHRRQLDCYMDEIETELLRRAGVVLEGGIH